MADEIEINGTVYKIGDKVRGKYSVLNKQLPDAVEGIITSIDPRDKKASLEVESLDRFLWIDNDTVEPSKKKYKYSFLID